MHNCASRSGFRFVFHKSCFSLVNNRQIQNLPRVIQRLFSVINKFETFIRRVPNTFLRMWLVTHGFCQRTSTVYPIPVAARSKAWVCGRSLAGITGSNPARGKGVCYECCMLIGRGLCDGPIPRPEKSYWLWCVCVCVCPRNLSNKEA